MTAIKIGFIGLGLMGRGMVANFLKAGFDTTVHDLYRDAAEPFVEKGATWAESPRALAELCNVVFTSLPTPRDVEAVGFGPEGLIEGLCEGSVWLDLSTNSLETVRSAHARLAARNVQFMDAPVSGGPRGANSGTLAIWIGGDKPTYDRLGPVLAAIADQPNYIGEIGAGTIAKLVHNMASTAINAVMAETLTMGVKAGLDLLPLWKAIRAGAAGRKRSFDVVGPRFLQDNVEVPNFQLRLALKDISLALDLGREQDVPMRICTLVQQDMIEAVNRGWGERDSQSFLVMQQERAAVAPFRLSAEEVEAVMLEK
ncbi:NAD(P)-dependent oxidoreductase [Paracoccus sp. (in: a-proteobacteria)]|uniref:NAD(P)-dependent oxidoreductase n=1 Tax=Paracoccus sp. TaxID=267 RepID=UPI002B001F00|nr:NAD(P)-dependent oxidoreductase [Paracoccus sp. (in: a-proteobacteria)]